MGDRREGELVGLWVGSKQARRIQVTNLRLSIGWLLVSRSLDLLSVHAHAQLRSSPQKEFMIVSSGIGPLRDATKAIQIELALEGCQFSLTKVLFVCGLMIACETMVMKENGSH